MYDLLVTTDQGIILNFLDYYNTRDGSIVYLMDNRPLNNARFPFYMRDARTRKHMGPVNINGRLSNKIDCTTDIVSVHSRPSLTYSI